MNISSLLVPAEVSKHGSVTVIKEDVILQILELLFHRVE
jgi:hypothetical protein